MKADILYHCLWYLFWYYKQVPLDEKNKAPRLLYVSDGTPREVSCMTGKFLGKTLLHLAAALALSALLGGAAWAGASVEDILNGRTAFHWGDNFLCWVVHYPEEMVKPWVRKQAGAGGDPAGEMARELRKSLRLDDSTPVLLSVHGFTAEPVVLSPLPERFYLKTPEGERIRPRSYESIFDEPLTGLAQGLVFFPRVEGPFTPVLESPSGRQMVFEFPEERENRIRKEEAKKLEERYDRASRADAAKMEALLAQAKSEAAEEVESLWEEELKKLRIKLEEVAAQRDMLRRRLDEALAQAAAASRRALEAAEKKPGTAGAGTETKPAEPAQKEPGWGRDQVAMLFVTDWKKGDFDSMQGYLSPALREEIKSGENLRELFREKVLPEKLPADARIKDEGGEAVKVVFASKMLFVRTLRSVDLGLFRGDAGWFVGSID